MGNSASFPNSSSSQLHNPVVPQTTQQQRQSGTAGTIAPAARNEADTEKEYQNELSRTYNMKSPTHAPVPMPESSQRVCESDSAIPSNPPGTRADSAASASYINLMDFDGNDEVEDDEVDEQLDLESCPDHVKELAHICLDMQEKYQYTNLDFLKAQASPGLLQRIVKYENCPSFREEWFRYLLNSHERCLLRKHWDTLKSQRQLEGSEDQRKGAVLVGPRRQDDRSHMDAKASPEDHETDSKFAAVSETPLTQNETVPEQATPASLDEHADDSHAKPAPEGDLEQVASETAAPRNVTKATQDQPQQSETHGIMEPEVFEADAKYPEIDDELKELARTLNLSEKINWHIRHTPWSWLVKNLLVSKTLKNKITQGRLKKKKGPCLTWFMPPSLVKTFKAYKAEIKAEADARESAENEANSFLEIPNAPPLPDDLKELAHLVVASERQSNDGEPDWTYVRANAGASLALFLTRRVGKRSHFSIDDVIPTHLRENFQASKAALENGTRQEDTQPSSLENPSGPRVSRDAMGPQTSLSSPTEADTLRISDDEYSLPDDSSLSDETKELVWLMTHSKTENSGKVDWKQVETMASPHLNGFIQRRKESAGNTYDPMIELIPEAQLNKFETASKELKKFFEEHADLREEVRDWRPKSLRSKVKEIDSMIRSPKSAQPPSSPSHDHIKNDFSGREARTKMTKKRKRKVDPSVEFTEDIPPFRPDGKGGPQDIKQYHRINDLVYVLTNPGAVDELWEPAVVKSYRVIGTTPHGDTRSYSVVLTETNLRMNDIEELRLKGREDYEWECENDIEIDMKGVSTFRDVRSKDKCVRIRGWFYCDDIKKNFSSACDAMRAYDKAVVEKKGNTTEPNDLNFPELWDFRTEDGVPVCTVQPPDSTAPLMFAETPEDDLSATNLSTRVSSKLPSSNSGSILDDTETKPSSRKPCREKGQTEYLEATVNSVEQLSRSSAASEDGREQFSGAAASPGMSVQANSEISIGRKRELLPVDSVEIPMPLPKKHRQVASESGVLPLLQEANQVDAESAPLAQHESAPVPEKREKSPLMTHDKPVPVSNRQSVSDNEILASSQEEGGQQAMDGRLLRTVHEGGAAGEIAPTVVQKMPAKSSTEEQQGIPSVPPASTTQEGFLIVSSDSIPEKDDIRESQGRTEIDGEEKAGVSAPVASDPRTTTSTGQSERFTAPQGNAESEASTPVANPRSDVAAPENQAQTQSDSDEKAGSSAPVASAPKSTSMDGSDTEAEAPAEEVSVMVNPGDVVAADNQESAQTEALSARAALPANAEKAVEFSVFNSDNTSAGTEGVVCPPVQDSSQELLGHIHGLRSEIENLRRQQEQRLSLSDLSQRWEQFAQRQEEEWRQRWEHVAQRQEEEERLFRQRQAQSFADFLESEQRSSTSEPEASQDARQAVDTLLQRVMRLERAFQGDSAL